jgi:hypothetical protein
LPAIVAPVIAVAGAVFSAGAAVVGAGVAAAGALGIGTGTLLGVVASAALIGVEYLLRPSNGGQPQLAPPPAGTPTIPARKTLRQSDMPRCFIFGRTRTSGAYLMYETDGYYNSSPGGITLYQGIYICDGPVDGFDAFICDDETPPIIRTSTDGGITDGSSDANVFAFTSGMKYGSFNLGSNKISRTYAVAFEPVNAQEAGYYPKIFGDTFNYDNALVTAMWPTTCLGKGMTCVYTWASTQYITTTSGSRPIRFPSGFPEWSFCVRGARVYDPRDDSQTETEGGAWTLYNTTWTWSENPALIAAHFVRWLIDQNLTAIVGVDWTSVATAADDCDAIVSATMRNIEGGAAGAASEPFARMTGVYYFDTPPREFLSKIMAACDGTYSIDQDGKFTLWIGKWEDPSVTFDESDVSSFTEEFLPPTSEAVNEIHSTYIEPQNSYQRFEAPVWTDDESIARISRRLVSINYDLVPSPGQAYRLSQRYARRINGKRKLQITLGPRGMLAFKQRVVGLSLPSFGIEESTWRVEALQPEGNLTRWVATLREVTESVFDDDPAPRDPATALKVASQFTASAPSGFTLAAYPGSTAGTSYVVISLNAQHLNDAAASEAGITTAGVVQEQTLVFEAYYSTNGVDFSTATTYLSNYVARTPDLANGVTVTVDSRFMNADGSYTAYSSQSTIDI